MSNDLSPDLTTICRARVAKDGKRILCDIRNQCSGELAYIATAFVSLEGKTDSNGAPISGDYEETLVYLDTGIGIQRDGTWRKTKRPGWRTHRKILQRSGQRIKFSDNHYTLWGTDRHTLADYKLPVPVVCPRCKRLNLITGDLIPYP